MLAVGDVFEFSGIKYTVLDVITYNGEVYYKVRGECGAIKLYPASIEKMYPIYRKL